MRNTLAVVLVAVVILSGCGDRLNINLLYVDSSGYFAVITPEEWLIRDYMYKNSVMKDKRTIAEFKSNTDKHTKIYVVANSWPDEHQASLVKNENGNLRKQISLQILDCKTAERTQAIRRENYEFRSSGMLRAKDSRIYSESTAFHNGNVSYGVSLHAGSKTSFDEHYQIYQEFIDNFIILNKHQNCTEGEVKAVLLSISD